MRTGLGAVAASAFIALALAGCGRPVGETLGIQRRAPDEFQVVRRAPLILPPDYNLRPPQPGASPAQQQDVAAQAEALLVGQAGQAAPAASAASAARSPGEQALLAQSPVESEPNIRQILVAENQDLIDLDEGRFLFILNFQRRGLERREPVIDPVAEAQRLAAEGAAGSVVTERTGSQPLVR